MHVRNVASAPLHVFHCVVVDAPNIRPLTDGVCNVQIVRIGFDL